MLAAADHPPDQLFLLPECVLNMDSTQLRRDLAQLDFRLHSLLANSPKGSVWLSGATPDDQKTNRPSSAKQSNQGGPHWFGHYEGEPPESDGSYCKDREERIKLLKEKQNEDRQRKLEELKQQALAAQKFREQKEEERKKRLEELRARDCDRRAQVEERKRQIWEAERDRREAILKKNQEREARIEAKRKNERSSIIFAFGSSTPRMLEPGETASYWASRRATSTTNVMTLSMSAAQPLTRRSSERELDGSKKRATSAGGIERKSPLDEFDGLGSTRRKKTDLTPTLPSPRDASAGVTPSRSFKSKNSVGRAFSMSRLDSLAQPRVRVVREPSNARKDDVTRSMSNLAASSAAAGTRPTGRMASSRSMLTLPRLNRAEKLRLKARQPTHQEQTSPTGMRSGEATPSRPISSMSQHSVASNLSQASANLRSRPVGTPRKPRPVSIAVTGISSPQANDVKNTKSPSVSGSGDKPPIPKVHTTKKSATPKAEPAKKPTDKVKSTKNSSATSTPVKGSTPLESPIAENVAPIGGNESAQLTTSVFAEETLLELTEASADELVEVTPSQEESKPAVVETIEPAQQIIEPTPVVAAPVTPAPVVSEPSVPEKIQIETPAPPPPEDRDSEMNTSMSKMRITTEEEAKAALAERRRLAREQAEREAELERQRLEAERLAEEERLRKEEEEQRKMEEEQLKLLEEAKQAEELRLQQAIEEAQRREEEERKRREEEEKAKKEKEEADKKAKEEAEKQRLEMEIRLKKEEEDRQARRKRVEAIMLRTRGKGSTSTTTPTKDGDDGMETSPPNEEKNGEDKISDSDKMQTSLISESDKMQTSLISESDKMQTSLISESDKMQTSLISETDKIQTSLKSEKDNLPKSLVSENDNLQASLVSENDKMQATLIAESDKMQATLIAESDKIQTTLLSESDKFLDSERNHTDANSHSPQVNNKHNGHHNGSIHSVSENNVTNTLLDLSTEPVDQILDLSGANGKITEPQLQNPFIPFQEKSEPPTLNDLLS